MVDIYLLPVHVFEQIAYRLSIKDVLSCSLVNTDWRNAFNNDRLWRLQCKKWYSSISKRKEFAKNCVKPNFQLPSCNSERITPLCTSRINFMKEVHLTNNWRSGNYVSYKFPNAVGLVDSDSGVQCDGTLMMVPTSNLEKSFTVWNIEEGPTEVSKCPYLLQHVCASLFKLEQSKLVIVQCNLLQVFSNVSDTYQLLFRKLMDKSYEESNLIPDVYDLTDWYIKSINHYPCDYRMNCDHNGHICVGVVIEGGMKNILHIWNIDTGEKLKETSTPESNDVEIGIHICESMLFVSCTDLVCEKYTIIYGYDLNLLSFTNLKLVFPFVVPYIDFSIDSILSLNKSKRLLSLWNVKTGESVSNSESSNTINAFTIKFKRNKTVYVEELTNRISSVVKILETASLTVVHEFQTDFTIFDVSIVQCDLLLITNDWEIQIWDVTRPSKLLVLNYEDCLWLCETNQKLVVENYKMLFVLHFW